LDIDSHLASVGAILIILVLGLSTFTQQTLVYVSAGVIDPLTKAEAVASYAYFGISGENPDPPRQTLGM
jgi:hypothetical protein